MSSRITFTLYGSQKEEKGPESLSEEILPENFPSLKKEIDIQVQ